MNEETIARSLIATIAAGAGAMCLKFIDKFVVSGDKLTDEGAHLRKELHDESVVLRKELTEVRTEHFDLQKQYLELDSRYRLLDIERTSLKLNHDNVLVTVGALKVETKVLRRLVKMVSQQIPMENRTPQLQARLDESDANEE